MLLRFVYAKLNLVIGLYVAIPSYLSVTRSSNTVFAVRIVIEENVQRT